jgi:hypothetical protein
VVVGFGVISVRAAGPFGPCVMVVTGVRRAVIGVDEKKLLTPSNAFDSTG